MNNKRKSKVVDTFMKEEVEKCKKRSSEILADEKKIFGVKVRRKSVINFLIFLESLKNPSQIPNSCLRHWPTPTKIDRRAAADTVKSAHSFTYI